ncbi:MAG: hypothetical protein AAFX52_14460 [Pseudomonadota bacterium]
MAKFSYLAAVLAMWLMAPALGLAQEPGAEATIPQWKFVSGSTTSTTGQRLDAVVEACRNNDAPFAKVVEERTFVDAYEDRNEFGSSIVVFRLASWSEDDSVVVRLVVKAAESAIRGADGVLTIIGQPGALEGYNWMYAGGDEPIFAGPSPDTMPFEVPCANAELGAELLNQILPFLPSGQGPLDIVEASYQGYLRNLKTRFGDDRLDPIVDACRAPTGAPRPAIELISAGYDDDQSSETSGRFYVTIVHHSDQSKELATYFLDPSVSFGRIMDDKSLSLFGGDAGTAGHTGWFAPGGAYSHVGSFEPSPDTGDTGPFYCANPDLASAAVYGLRVWLKADLPRAPHITYALRFDEAANEDVTACLFSDSQAALVVEQALSAEGLHPLRTKTDSTEAHLQFVLTPRYEDMMLPDRCHYGVDTEASWAMTDPGALMVDLRTDPMETSFRDLDIITSRVGRDFLEQEKRKQAAPDPASLP